MLLRIDNTLDTLVEKTGNLTMQVGSIQAQINELTERLSTQAYQLDHDLKTYIQSQYFGPEFQKKNQELIKIKAQLKQIEEEKARQTKPQALAIDLLSMYPPPYPTYSPILSSPQYSPPKTLDYEFIFKPTYHLAQQFHKKKHPSLIVQPT
ncbi:hypothetical protein PIB30_102288, partial [Stylosanthes scabra]|nr:hypothetical protein [Stylosanthes scabra]